MSKLQFRNIRKKQRNPKEMEEVMVLASSKDASSSGVLRVSEDRIEIILKAFDCLVQKGVILTFWFKHEVG